MTTAMNEHLAPPAYRTDEDRWDAVKRRDPAADGIFYTAVATTGVYCRPTCTARLARRENVSFYPTCAAAEAAGFRPCKRCRPNGPSQAELHARVVAQSCRMIEEAEETPSLDDLARSVGLSSYHFHRVFKEVTGLTPKAYANAHRSERVREGLERGARVTETIYEAGFGSSSRFYERAEAMLGMTPKAYRDGGRDSDIKFCTSECSLGAILVAATPRGVCAIQFADTADELVRDLRDRFPKARLSGDDGEFSLLVATVVAAVEDPRKAADLPLDVRGTAFQQRVWQALRQIPPGSTASYAEIAARVGQPTATRAVAQACAANPAAVAIPCHRVVRKTGGAGGYRWGVARKRALLEREAQ